MIPLLMATLALASDPVALRQAHSGDVASVALTGSALSAAWQPASGPGLSVNTVAGGYVGAAVGWNRPLVGADRTWGVDVHGGGGLDVLWASPGVALAGTGSVVAGARGGRGRWLTGLVVPLGVRLDRPELAAPLVLESRLGLRVGPLWLGAHGQAGAVLASGGPPSMHAKAGLSLTLAPTSSDTGG